MIRIFTSELPLAAVDIKAGDPILLSGEIICARDAAHKRFSALLAENKPLPFDPHGAVIYYAGPTPARPGQVIGSCGPTTSSRMDAFTPELLKSGVCATIGKGKRCEEVIKAIKEYKAPYFCAIGGAGAIASKSICAARVIAFDDLGCEAVRLLTFRDFPLICGIDIFGGCAI